MSAWNDYFKELKYANRGFWRVPHWANNILKPDNREAFIPILKRQKDNSSTPTDVEIKRITGGKVVSVWVLQLMRILGFLKKENHNHFITDAGNEYLSHHLKRNIIFQNQLEKWFFYNHEYRPGEIEARGDIKFRVYPIFALANLLLELQKISPSDTSISFEEFVYFVGSIYEYNQSKKRAKLIVEYRNLSPPTRTKLQNKIKPTTINDYAKFRPHTLLKYSDFFNVSSPRTDSATYFDTIELNTEQLNEIKERIKKFENDYTKKIIPKFDPTDVAGVESSKYKAMLYSSKSLLEFSKAMGGVLKNIHEKTTPKKGHERVTFIQQSEKIKDKIEKKVDFDELLDHDLLMELSEKLRTPQKVEKIVPVIVRHRKYINILKDLYKGECQVCGTTFKTKSGANYSEAHHFVPLGDEGSDSPSNILIFCPTCHKKFHYAKIGKPKRSKNIIDIWVISPKNKVKIKFNQKHYKIFKPI